MYNLNRFIEVQKKDYNNALNEIKNGEKLTHWVWYIFPQIKGLGISDIASYYSIDNLEEAKAYLGNDYLKNNLLEITQALLDLNSDNISEVLGYPDDLKVKSCMTLFHYADPNISLFKQVIDKYYNGEFDINTINIIEVCYNEKSDSMNNNEENNQKFGLIYTTWFLASMLACFIFFFSPYDYLMKLAYGQFFLINGLVQLFTDGVDVFFVSFTFIIAGASLIIIPTLINIFGDVINWAPILVLIMLSLFILLSVSFIVTPVILRKKKEKNYDVVVDSTTGGHKVSRTGDRVKIYSSIYYFDFNKKKYMVSHQHYNNIGIKPTGTKVELKIDLENPDDFTHNDNSAQAAIIFGIIALIFILPILIFVITHFNEIK